MKALLCLWVAAWATPAELDSSQMQQLRNFEKNYDAKTNLSGTNLRYNLQYAALLYGRNQAPDSRKADLIIEKVISYQNTDKNAQVYGQSGFAAGDTPGDLNVALFHGPYYFIRLWPHIIKMAPATAEKFKQSARRLAEAADRRWDEEVFDIHRDFKAYTNVFIMQINTLQLAGNALQDERLRRRAESQWQRWFNHISYYGIDEFTSPSYSNIDIENLLNIHEYARQPKMKAQVTMVLDFFATQQYAVSHPLLKTQIVGSSRNYRSFVKPGNNEVDIIKESPEGSYTKPAQLAQEYANRTFPYEASGRATIHPFFYKSYQTANGGLGSMTGGNYFWQQIHCLVALGKNEEERALAYLPGSFTPINGFVEQQKNTALCVFSRTANTYIRTQAQSPYQAIKEAFGGFGMGVTTGWQEKVNNENQLILSAYNQEMHVYPFALKNGKVVPVKLVYKKRDKTTEKNYHKREADFGEYVFPDDAAWVGCWVTYVPAGTKVPKPTITYQLRNKVITVKAKNLILTLFQQPAGEITQLYKQDWRTTPLLQTPAETVCPANLPAVRPMLRPANLNNVFRLI